ncbi:Spy/CpxP family protein refolding chaperone [Piscinibacter koreensis]|uniref:Spy/CpxP family protein refolding chaperone n=1 Tax=Piscinibacter koreensis TaxID=2742824 RepID=A0A7Y6TXK0_9BURK|nr:Spy/CpxP family protein refolding chaperone [Schlegelella koreensis]NUZ07248.1 Spy/CpxP family protein refolding chaperone [Schlegelella koreensis]
MEQASKPVGVWGDRVATAKMMAAGLLIAAAGLVATPASAQPMMGGGHHGHHGAMASSPERMGRHLDRMLDGLNATDAQRAQIKQIYAAAAADLKAQRQPARDLHQRQMQIFTAPTVDARAAEQVRQEMMAHRDQVSRRMTQAMIEASRVLTPEQRAKIGERMKERAARMQERMQRLERERR